MTANSDLKKLIRSRMRKTGQSYTAARRSFLHSKDADTMHDPSQKTFLFRLPVSRLELTMRTERILKQHEINTIGALAGKSEAELVEIGLSAQSRIEIRDVLASRGI